MSTKENAYLDYVCERESLLKLDVEHGFALYAIRTDHVLLRDVFVAKGFRKGGTGRKIVHAMEQLAVEHGLKYVVTQVSPPAIGSTESLKACLACGFQLASCEKDVIFLMKTVGSLS